MTEMFRLQQTGVIGNGFEEMIDTVTAEYGCVFRRIVYRPDADAVYVGVAARKTSPSLNSVVVWQLASAQTPSCDVKVYTWISFHICILTNQCTINNTVVSLYNLHCYMFRHSCHHQTVYSQCLAKLHTFYRLQMLEIQFINLIFV